MWGLTYFVLYLQLYFLYWVGSHGGGGGIGAREVIQQTAHNKFEFKKDKMRHIFLPIKVTRYKKIVNKYTIYVVNFEFYFYREGQKNLMHETSEFNLLVKYRIQV